MQKLELSCQEADFMLSDALNKIKRSATTTNNELHQTVQSPPHQSLLLNHQSNNHIHQPNHVNHQNDSIPTKQQQSQELVTHTASGPSNRTISPTIPIVSNPPETNNNTSSSPQHCEKRSAVSENSSAMTSSPGGGNAVSQGSPAKKAKVTSTISRIAAVSSAKVSIINGVVNNGNDSASATPFFDIHEKLRELYVYLYLKDTQDSQADSRIKLRSRSFVLETLVAKENLNTIILNLYPGNKGYSLAFRQESPATNRKADATTDTSTESGGSRSAIKPGRVNQEKEEHLLETIRWPFEMSDWLESINNEELPVLYMELLESCAPNAFYSGCVIVEVRDYRQSFPISACCDNYFVLLRPTTQTLLADARTVSMQEEFTHEDCVLLESNIVLATAGPLCLDPSPKVARKAVYSQYKRQMWNSSAIRRQMRKFSQVAINRKRKTDQFTHRHGTKLCDFLARARQKPPPTQRPTDTSLTFISKTSRKAIDIIKPIRTPNLDLPTTLAPPTNVNVADYAKAYDRPEDTKDCMPQLIEEYVFETDRGCGRIYHIKLSIYQRPSNSKYLGELYVDRDYQKDSRNGEACRFSLGTRAHANRYIQQFTEIFTEEGRKSVKITHLVPGQPAKISCTTGMVEHWNQQQQQQQQQQQTRLQPSPQPTAQQQQPRLLPSPQPQQRPQQSPQHQRLQPSPQPQPQPQPPARLQPSPQPQPQSQLQLQLQQAMQQPGPPARLLQSPQSQQKPIQHLSILVTMNNPGISPQNHQFTQVIQSPQPLPQQPQQIILNNVTNVTSAIQANRIITQQTVRRDSVPSPGPDSNASNNSVSSIGAVSTTNFAISPTFSTFFATTTSPVTSGSSDASSTSVTNQSALLERLTNINNPHKNLH